MKWIFGFICTLILTNTGLAASWETTALRTPSGALVRLGMSSEEARKELGHPPRARSAVQGSDGKKGGKKEILSYRGEDGLYTVTLSGGQVVKIVVTPKRD